MASFSWWPPHNGSSFLSLPLSSFLRRMRRRREKRQADRQAVGHQQQLPASDWVGGTFLLSSYIKPRMCAPIVQGYWVTPREQSIPQIPLTTHDQVMQAGDTIHVDCLICRGSWGWQLQDYISLTVSLSQTTPSLSWLPPRPEFRTSHWTGTYQSANIDFTMWQLKITCQRLQVRQGGDCPAWYTCTQDFLREAFSPTFFSFLPVATNWWYLKGATVFRMLDI